MCNGITQAALTICCYAKLLRMRARVYEWARLLRMLARVHDGIVLRWLLL